MGDISHERKASVDARYCGTEGGCQGVESNAAVDWMGRTKNEINERNNAQS